MWRPFLWNGEGVSGSFEPELTDAALAYNGLNVYNYA